MMLLAYLTLVLLHKAIFAYKKVPNQSKKRSNIFFMFNMNIEHASFDQNSFVHDERVRVSIATRFLDFLRNAQMSQQTG